MKLKENDPWCGVIPLKTKYGEPQKDAQLPDSLELPSYISELVDGSSTI